MDEQIDGWTNTKRKRERGKAIYCERREKLKGREEGGKGTRINNCKL